MKAHLHEEFKLWSFVVLFQSQSRMQGGKREKSNMKNSRGQKLLDIFWVLPRVHFIHNICFFEAWEVRSPMLQTMCKLELKRRSYGRLKTTAQSWAKISQLRNEIHLRNFARCFTATKPPASTHVPLRKLKLHFRSCEPRREITSKLRIKLQIISKLWNHNQVAKSQIQLAKSKFKLAKWINQRVNHLAKSTCTISDICNRLS